MKKNIYFLKKISKLNFPIVFYHFEQAIKIVFLNLFENFGHISSAKDYMFTDNIRNTRKKVRIMFKVNNKDPEITLMRSLYF